MDLKCRTCSREIQDETAVNIFTRKNSEESVADMLMLFAPVTIRKEDELPKTICLNCFAKLSISYDFRNSVMTSDLQLKQQILKANLVRQKILFFSLEDDAKMLTSDNDVDMDVWEVTARTESISLDSDDVFETIEIVREDDDNQKFDLKSEDNRDETNCEKNEVVREDLTTVASKVSPQLPQQGKKFRFFLTNPKKIEEPVNFNFVCLKCGKRFRRLMQLKLHNFTHLKAKRIVCFECNAKFIDKRHFLRHFRARHSKNPTIFPCNFCGDSLETSRTLRDHDKLHANETTDTKVDSSKNLDKNQCRHCGSKSSYKCPHCGLKYKETERFVRHIRSCLNPFRSDEKLSQCTYCGRKIANKKSFVRHIQNHSIDKPHRCDRCDRNIAQDDHVIKQVARVRLNEKRVKGYRCTNCCRRYHVKVDVKKIGEKPYQCMYCGREFDQKIVLNRHVKSHTGKNPYQCPHCGKKFIRISTMERHVARIHKNPKRKKPYQCSHCGKRLEPII